MKIAIIGKGNVGSALERGLSSSGHQLRAVGSDPGAAREAARWAEVVILAVPFGQVGAAVDEIGNAADSKPLVDVTNALGKDMQLAVGFTTSGAEELQKKLPKAHVVKAFNTVFAKHMDSGKVDGERLSAFIAGDDATAKQIVMDLARNIGFEPVDSGPLRNARLLEPLAMLNIQLGYALGRGPDIGFKLAHM